MKKNGWIVLTVGLMATLFTSCLLDNYEPEIPTVAQEQMALKSYLNNIISLGSDVDTTAQGNYYVVLEEGAGDYAKSGDTLNVGYAGYFVDGDLFDASEWHNTEDGTYEFILGNPPMIKGWDEGMLLMNKNRKIQLIIPSENAYGASGSGSIPPYSTLIFVIKMVEIKPLK